jgi:HAE1 family hydrophobic/amphiphilic exporter-1
VFLPVVFIQEEAGQLFKDIAIAVTCAVSLSLLVSVSVIPMFSKQLFSLAGKKPTLGKTGSVARAGGVLVEIIVKMVGLAIRNWATRIITIVLLTSLAVFSAKMLFPKMEYLPQGNRNLVINILIPPPGLSYEERKEIGETIFRMSEPHFNKDRDGIPGIKKMFYLGAERIMIFGGISIHEQHAGQMRPLFMRIIYSIPGMFGISTQAGIFQTRLGRGRSVEIDISSGDLNRLMQVAGMMFGMLMKELPDAQVRPIPSLELLYPEVKIIPSRDKLKAVQMSADELGVVVDVLMDGRNIGDFKQPGEKKIDLVLKASEKSVDTPEGLYQSLVATPDGMIVPLYSLAEIERTSGITQIRHLERQRTVTLQVTPPERMPLQEAMEFIENKIIPSLKGQGMLEGMTVRLSGAADKLTETRKAMQWNFLLALMITYLLMSALFGNFFYPFIVMFTVPLAAAGGFIGLKLVNVLITPQPLDILTMLGFIILIGVVVNNAILVVYQALNNVRDYGMCYRDAVLDSVRTRLRPIYMSASTSVFGMLPLVVAPGPGSELYRGLGSVVLGGLAFSTVFTIFVIPALLMFFIRMEKTKPCSGLSLSSG